MRWPHPVHRRRPSLALCGPLLLLLGAWNPLERPNRAVTDGNGAMKSGNAEDALTQYDKAVAALPNDPGAHFDRGTALFALSRYDEAILEFMRATEAKAPSLRASAFYNLGNSYFKADRFGDAVAAYKRSLVLDPSDMRAKWNLELALQKKKEEDKKKQDQQNKDQQKQDQQKQDQQNQDQNQDQKQDQQNQEQKQDQQNQDQKNQDGEQKKDDEKKDNQDKQQPSDAGTPKQDQKQGQEPEPPPPQPEQEQNAAKPRDEKAPEMNEIDAVLDSLERSPKDLEKMRARVRAVRRAPPAKDW